MERAVAMSSNQMDCWDGCDFAEAAGCRFRDIRQIIDFLSIAFLSFSMPAYRWFGDNKIFGGFCITSGYCRVVFIASGMHINVQWSHWLFLLVCALLSLWARCFGIWRWNEERKFLICPWNRSVNKLVMIPLFGDSFHVDYRWLSFCGNVLLQTEQRWFDGRIGDIQKTSTFGGLLFTVAVVCVYILPRWPDLTRAPDAFYT